MSADRSRPPGGPWPGFALVLGSLLAVALVPLQSSRAAPLAAVLLVGGAGWALALRAAAARPGRPGFPWAVAGGALVLRLVALGASPGLSDDAYRYVWEGALVLEGQSPYAHAPLAPELAAERALRPTVFAGVNHPEVSAAYPPLTQLACAAVVWLAGGERDEHLPRTLLALRVAFACADLLVLVPLVRLLRLAGRAPELACAWAWSPLVALEFAGTGHFDALGILLLVTALATRRAGLAALALAGGTLVKLLPILAAPFVARTRAHPWRWLALVGGLVGLGLATPLALRDGGLGLASGLSEYALRWESFHLLHRWIEAPLDGWLVRDEGWSDPRRVARWIGAALGLGFALWVWLRGAPRVSGTDPRPAAAHATFLVLGGFLVLTPTLHPWYLTWVIPFLALRPLASWTWLVAVAPLCYWPLEGWLARGEWSEPAWLWPLVALPFWALLARDARRALHPR